MEEPKGILTSFYQRAHQAEERLARLEAALASKQDDGIKELIEKVDKLQLKLEEARLLQINEREKALKEVEQLTLENAKLQYRVTHLVRALQEADQELASNSEVAICDATKSAE